MRVIEIPVPGLVVLIGAAGAGKSTLAARLFTAAEILSSDALREAVSGDAADQRATRPAFAILHREARRRLSAGRLVVVDATNVTTTARAPLVRIAHDAGVPAIAIALLPAPADVHAWNAARPGRFVPADIVDRHLASVARLGQDATTIRSRLLAEGFSAVHVLSSTAELAALEPVQRVRLQTPIPGPVVGDPSAGAILDDLVRALDRSLADGLVGAYLTGSAVAGGYDPGVSDLDVVVVTSGPARKLDLEALGGLHRDVKARNPGWDDRLEIVYVGRAALLAFRTSRGPLAVMSPGEAFHLRTERPIQWLQNWYLLREQGHALLGPAPAALLPPIGWTEFLGATRRYAAEIASSDLVGARPGAVAYRS